MKCRWYLGMRVLACCCILAITTWGVNDACAAPPTTSAAPVDASAPAFNGNAFNAPPFDARPFDAPPVAAPALERLPPTSLDSSPSVIPTPEGWQPIDLDTALGLAERMNPTLGGARAAVRENQALLMQARATWLPSLVGGGNYHYHTGALQQNAGNITSMMQQSLYLGAGAMAVGSGPAMVPGVQFYNHLGDAFFNPLAARQQLVSTQFTARATNNNVLLQVSDAYWNLLAAEMQHNAWLQSERDLIEVTRLTIGYAKAGAGRLGDAERAETALFLLRNDVVRTEERTAVAAARLAALLQLDPSVRLRILETPLETIQLVDPQYHLPELLAIAQSQRPELAAQSARVATAQTRYRQEVVRPLVPTVMLGYSGGTFGAGSSATTPALGGYNGRQDFDAWAFWTLQNFGAGNAALQGRRRAEMRQADADRLRVFRQVEQEVAEAYARVHAATEQVPVFRQQLVIADDGLRRDMNRIRASEGLPIEVLNSQQLLAQARQDFIAAIVEVNQAQFGLFTALGQPATAAVRLPAAAPDTPPPPPP
ncbi:MAG TPA: TolC family protein [Pirellulales bacterium]|nr:TolC family protein [Pirellulales bacterium]